MVAGFEINVETDIGLIDFGITRLGSHIEYKIEKSYNEPSFFSKQLKLLKFDSDFSVDHTSINILLSSSFGLLHYYRYNCFIYAEYEINFSF